MSMPYRVRLTAYLSIIGILIFPFASHADTQSRGIEKIGHVIVIYQENWSFDGLYGMFPEANGLSNAGSAAGQVDAGGDAERRPDGECHRNLDRLDFGNEVWVRVKRRGKSPPLQAQARRHGKPHRVQGQIGNLGAARSTFRTTERVPGTGC